jgi:ribonucleoside-triphosphate reductase
MLTAHSITHTWDVRFVEELQYLKKKHSGIMFDLEGIGDNDLDINAYSNRFFSNKTTADVSVDSNSNIASNDVVTWEHEGPKALLRLNALFLLWKRAEGTLGIKRANKLLEAEIIGSLRVHDLHKVTSPYCYATSLDRLVSEGMPFYKKIKIGAIKHFDSFFNVGLQHICYMSNVLAGAVAVPTLLVDASYFLEKDFGMEWFKNEAVVSHVRQTIQSFIFSINYSFRSGAQSPFVNISVFDLPWLKSLFGDHIYPNFSKVNFDNVQRLQRLFVEVLLENQQKAGPFTFPVMTAAMLYDKEGERAGLLLVLKQDLHKKPLQALYVVKVYLAKVRINMITEQRLEPGQVENGNIYEGTLGP